MILVGCVCVDFVYSQDLLSDSFGVGAGVGMGEDATSGAAESAMSPRHPDSSPPFPPQNHAQGEEAQGKANGVSTTTDTESSSASEHAEAERVLQPQLSMGSSTASSRGSPPLMFPSESSSGTTEETERNGTSTSAADASNPTSTSSSVADSEKAATKQFSFQVWFETMSERKRQA